MRFEGKSVLVTGASSGIGAATAELFAAEGASVLGLDLVGDGQRVLQCDVSSPESVRAAVQQVVDRNGRLDVVVNAAGVMKFSPITELAYEDWQRHLAVNTTGPFLVSQAAVPHLLETSGCIVTIASNSGIHGQPYNAAYCASKGGAVLLTKALAVELSKTGVRVNCICPGGVDTPLIATAAASIPADADRHLMARLNSLIPRFIPPSEIAEAVAYLASPAAASITGIAWMIDGGTQS